jgi:adenylosuccinate lyase
MPIHPIDMNLFIEEFGSREIREIFDEQGIIGSWLEFEATLARVQGRLGLIPPESAQEIHKKASLKYVSMERIKANYLKARLLTVAVIREIKRVCEGDHGEYVHYGATSQDVYDTSMAVRLKKACQILTKDLEEIKSHLLQEAKKFRSLILIGRTHGQHALPVTLGFKMAVWAESISEHIDRIEESKKRILQGSLSGAVGTFASFTYLFGEKALELEKVMMKELDIYAPRISIQPRLERLGEYLSLLSLISMTLEKIAVDIFMMQRPEVGELSCGFEVGSQVGSSTMPHKQNPIDCEKIRGLVRIIRADSHALMESIMRDERDRSGVYTEDIVIPEATILTKTVLDLTKRLLKGLQVHPENAQKNLKITNGLIMSEAVMLELSKKTGRKQWAHDVVYGCAMKAISEKTSFKRAILSNTEIAAYLDEQTIDTLLDQGNYLGLINHIIDQFTRGI